MKDISKIDLCTCYCPFYSYEKCPGNAKCIQTEGKMIKACTKCTFPHEAKNYEFIIEFLSKK